MDQRLDVTGLQAQGKPGTKPELCVSLRVEILLS